MTTIAQNIGEHLAPAQEKKAAENPARGDKATPPVPVVVQQPALSPVGTLGIVIVVAIFILLQQEDLRDRVIRLVGSKDLHRTTIALDDGAQRLSRYFLSQLAVNLGFGCIVSIALFFIGLPQPALWGVLSAVLRFVPYVGIWIAALFPLAMAAAVSSGWWMFGWTLALYLLLELVVAQGLEPLLYGRRTGLSPIAVVTSAIFWTWIWGPIGLLVSTPLTLCLVVLGRHVQRLEFLEVMLGDQPALTPVQSLYQRLLAGDADEAREQAEAALKEQPLAAWYDEVALEALRSAADDVDRGILRGERLAQFRETIGDVVEDLESWTDRADEDVPAVGPPWQSEGAVLCVAGRGPLDDAAALIFAQLLRRRGFGVRLISFRAASRRRISALEAGGAMLACLLYLDISGRPAHLRYLLERLRHRVAEAPVLIGLWPGADNATRDRDRREQLRVDYCAASLREALEQCEAASRARPVARAAVAAARPERVTPG